MTVVLMGWLAMSCTQANEGCTSLMIHMLTVIYILYIWKYLCQFYFGSIHAIVCVKSSSKYSLENTLSNNKKLIYINLVVPMVIASKVLKASQTSTLRSCEKLAMLILYQYCIHSIIWVVDTTFHGLWMDVWSQELLA